jgi:hypothetical protein
VKYSFYNVHARPLFFFTKTSCKSMMFTSHANVPSGSLTMTLAEVSALSSFFFLNCVMVVGDVGCVRVEGVDDIGLRDDWIQFFYH